MVFVVNTSKITSFICFFLAAFAPFSSLSKRPSFVTMSEQMVGTPGPGHYQLDSTQSSKIKGGESLQRKVRFMDSAWFCESQPDEIEKSRK